MGTIGIQHHVKKQKRDTNKNIINEDFSFSEYKGNRVFKQYKI